jgi:hypothetical protein
VAAAAVPVELGATLSQQEMVVLAVLVLNHQLLEQLHIVPVVAAVVIM